MSTYEEWKEHAEGADRMIDALVVLCLEAGVEWGVIQAKLIEARNG